MTEAGDVVREMVNQGFDEVRSTISFSLSGVQVEAITLLGTDAIDAIGNSFANVLRGNDGDNLLSGVTGSDLLTGGGGADRFRMSGALGPANVDTITDFQSGIDKIELDRRFFPEAGPVGPLSFGAFRGDGTVDETDRILYDRATGTVSYDADGSGAIAPIAFAILPGDVAIAASDFVIV